MRVSTKYSDWYWHSHLAYNIPFCHRYEEDVELFLKRYPELRNAVYTAINNKERCYEQSCGLVEIYPESYKYEITSAINK